MTVSNVMNTEKKRHKNIKYYKIPIHSIMYSMMLLKNDCKRHHIGLEPFPKLPLL